MPLRPGMPPDRGGNDPIRAAAQSNMQRGMTTPGTDPNQLPLRGAGQGPAAPGMQQPQQMGPSVGGMLWEAFDLYIANGARPEDTEEIRQFFEAFVELANTMAGEQAPAPQPAQPAPRMAPGRTAAAAPAPGRPS